MACTEEVMAVLPKTVLSRQDREENKIGKELRDYFVYQNNVLII